MKSKLLIEFENEHEVKRLISLINLGKDILQSNGRKQLGVSGFTDDDLARWSSELAKYNNRSI